MLQDIFRKHCLRQRWVVSFRSTANNFILLVEFKFWYSFVFWDRPVAFYKWNADFEPAPKQNKNFYPRTYLLSFGPDFILLILLCVQAEIYLFKEFAAKVERKVAENASLEEDYDDAPDEFKGNCFILLSLFRAVMLKWIIPSISILNCLFMQTSGQTCFVKKTFFRFYCWYVVHGRMITFFGFFVQSGN